jgi:hypothetical protein
MTNRYKGPSHPCGPRGQESSKTALHMKIKWFHNAKMGRPYFGKDRKNINFLDSVREPREECTLPGLVQLLEDCEISVTEKVFYEN